MSVTNYLYPITYPPQIKNELNEPAIPWRISPAVMERMTLDPQNKHFEKCDLLPSDLEAKFVTRLYLHSKPASFSIAKITCVHNSYLKNAFEIELLNTELEGEKFKPNLQDEADFENKNRIIQYWKGFTHEFYPFTVPDSTTAFQHARVLPLFHGTLEKKALSIFDSGHTFFGKQDFDSDDQKVEQISTDIGWYGSGIYFSDNADYAQKYSDGHLIVSWVSMREPYPITANLPHPNMCTDMQKLKGKGAYRKYNAHIIPVDSLNPNAPNCLDFYPCYRDQPPSCTEYIVFQRAQALPCFMIEVAPDSPALQIKQPYNFFDASMACKNGMLDEVKAWINEDPNRLKHKGSKGETLMHAAAAGNQLEVMQWLHSVDNTLIKSCIDGGINLMHIAAAKGFTQTAAWIHHNDPLQITLENKEKKTPFYYAALYQRIAFLKLFVKEIQANPSFIFQIIELPVPETLNFLLKHINPDITNKFKQTGLHLAAQSGQEGNVIELLTHHAKLDLPDHFGRTALYVAVLQGHHSIVRFLIQHGAKLNPITQDKETLLHASVFYGNVEIVQELLAYQEGKDLIFKKDIDGKTPLHKACWGHPKGEVVHLLIAHGANVIETNKYGYTPLHWACKHGHRSSAVHLINAGATVDIANVNGDTPMDLTIEFGQAEMIHLFLGTKELLPKDDRINPKDEIVNLLKAEKEGLIEEQIVSLIKISNFNHQNDKSRMAVQTLEAAYMLVEKLQNSTYLTRFFKQSLRKYLAKMRQLLH
jgi:ankyrin repeat protein